MDLNSFLREILLLVWLVFRVISYLSDFDHWHSYFQHPTFEVYRLFEGIAANRKEVGEQVEEDDMNLILAKQLHFHHVASNCYLRY